MAYVTNGLQLYLDAKDYPSSSTSTTWTDKSGNSNDGSLGSGIFAFDGSTSGWTGTSLAFDGINDNVTVPNAATLNPTSAITLEVLFTMSNINGEQYLFNKNNYVQYKISVATGSITATINSTDIIATTKVVPGAKYHVVVTYDRVSAKIYVNGQLEATKAMTSAINISTSNVIIGNGESWHYLTGKINLLRIYNTALSATDVNNNYQDATGTGGGTTPTNINLAGSISATSSANASLTVSAPIEKLLNSNLGIISTTQGTLTQGQGLIGSIVLTSSINASQSIGKLVTGSVNASVTTQAILSQAHLLTSNINNLSTISGNLNVIESSSLSCSVSVRTDINSSLNKTVNLTANIGIKATTQNQIDIFVLLNSSVTSKISVNALVDKIINLSGNIDSKSTSMLNVAVIPMRNLNGDIAIISRIQSSLDLGINLNGSIRSTSLTQAYMNLAQIIFAELNMRIVNKYDMDMVYSNVSELNMKL